MSAGKREYSVADSENAQLNGIVEADLSKVHWIENEVYLKPNFISYIYLRLPTFSAHIVICGCGRVCTHFMQFNLNIEAILTTITSISESCKLQFINVALCSFLIYLFGVLVLSIYFMRFGNSRL